MLDADFGSISIHGKNRTWWSMQELYGKGKDRKLAGVCNSTSARSTWLLLKVQVVVQSTIYHRRHPQKNALWTTLHCLQLGANVHLTRHLRLPSGQDSSLALVLHHPLRLRYTLMAHPQTSALTAKHLLYQKLMVALGCTPLRHSSLPQWPAKIITRKPQT